MAKKGSKIRGESLTGQFKNVTVSVWQDTKPVLVTATNSDPSTTSTVTRKQRKRNKGRSPIANMYFLYNKYMGV